jgi:hypothetical protein
MSSLLDPYRFESGAAPSSLILDDYPNCHFAVSLRYVSTAFIGNPVIQVARSSDSATIDVTPTEIVDGTLTSFVGANDGFIEIYYDQSGLNNDSVKVSDGRRSRIIVGGVLQTIALNGLPCTLMDGNNEYYQAYYVLPYQDELTMLSVCLPSQTVNPYRYAEQLTNLGVIRSSFSQGADMSLRYNGAATLGNGSTDGIYEKIRFSTKNGTSVTDYTNNVENINTVEPSINQVQGLSTNAPSSSRFQGQQQEVIIWGTEYLADREVITNRINSYYGYF